MAPARLMALGVVALGMLVLLGAAGRCMAARSGQQSLLYADLDLREAAQMTDALDRAHIGHQELGNRATASCVVGWPM